MEENNRMKLVVLAFGPLAERLGWRKSEIDIAVSSTVNDVLTHLGIEAHRSGALMVAVNGQQCEYTHQLSNTDELALLPPVSGG